MQKVSIAHVSNTHNDWLRALDFYKGEVSILKERLNEIAGKNTGKDMLQLVEHYENQFKVQIDNIDTLAHDIHANMSAMKEHATHTKASHIEGILLAQHSLLKHRFDAEEMVISELRSTFNRFAAEWM